MKTRTPPILITFALVCFALVQNTQAVSPSPDGGYGTRNTAEGTDSLFSLTTGAWNSAFGFRALYRAATAVRNTALGYQALYNTNGPYNVSGLDNVAVGANALFNNTIGNGNIAIGSYALYENTTGSNNIAIGTRALRSFNGSGNTVVGESFASDHNTVSLGREPTFDPRQGRTSDGVLTALINAENDIYVGSIADIGAGETFYTSAVHIQAQNDIYIGLPNPQTQRVHITATEAVFAAPVFSNPIAGSPVTIDSSGQLGVAPSSRRFKQEIKPLDKASETVLSLKPVAFRYKKELDPKGTPQFGLVAEEVEKVNPDLVVRDKEGKPYSVRYDAVNAMLLNEFLKEHRKNEEQQATIAQLQSGMEALTATVKEQAAQIQKVSAQLEANKPTPQVVANDQ
jgi:trimeric autotransporter adhesin